MSNETALIIMVALFLTGLFGGLYYALKDDKPVKKHT